MAEFEVLHQATGSQISEKPRRPFNEDKRSDEMIYIFRLSNRVSGLSFSLRVFPWVHPGVLSATIRLENSLPFLIDCKHSAANGSVETARRGILP